MSRRHVVSVPQWAQRAGLADDGRSIATARGLLAKGQGPQVVKVDRRDGVRLQEHETWAETTPWAKYLATLTASERDKQHSQAMRIVGDARYVTLLYGRYCTSRWRFQMTFEKWLKRRQSQKEKHTPRSRNKGGTK